MSQLTQLAAKLKAAEKARQEEQERKKEEEIKAILEKYEEEFRIGFADYLPMLEEEQITWQAVMKRPPWEHEGIAIQFSKGKKSCLMDFSNRTSYRFEYTTAGSESHCRTVYGAWDKDQIATFLVDGLCLDFPF